MTMCTGCRTPILGRIYEYIDGSNGTVSANSGKWCHECYGSRFGHRALTPVEFPFDGTLGFGHPLVSGDFNNRKAARAKVLVRSTPHGTRLTEEP